MSHRTIEDHTSRAKEYTRKLALHAKISSQARGKVNAIWNLEATIEGSGAAWQALGRWRRKRNRFSLKIDDSLLGFVKVKPEHIDNCGVSGSQQVLVVPVNDSLQLVGLESRLIRAVVDEHKFCCIQSKCKDVSVGTAASQ